MAPGDPVAGQSRGATGRKHTVRRRELLGTARRITASEGLEALSMSRIAREHHTVVSALYRYFPSKAALVADLQKDALDRLTASLERTTDRAEALLAARGVDGSDADLTRLVLIGRWFCAASTTLSPDVRLLQTLLFAPDDHVGEHGPEVLPHALRLIGHAVDAITAAHASGLIDDTDAFDRAVIWTAAMNGALLSDSLDRYLPGVFGAGRLARASSLDVLAGWGITREALAGASTVVDQLEAAGPLAS